MNGQGRGASRRGAREGGLAPLPKETGGDMVHSLRFVVGEEEDGEDEYRHDADADADDEDDDRDYVWSVRFVGFGTFLDADADPALAPWLAKIAQFDSGVIESHYSIAGVIESRGSVSNSAYSIARYRSEGLLVPGYDVIGKENDSERWFLRSKCVRDSQ